MSRSVGSCVFRFKMMQDARIALCARLINWLESIGMFKDSRAYRHLLPLLQETDQDRTVLDRVGRDFVVQSIASGFPTSAIIRNLNTAITSAARFDNWPVVARYVEMIRSADMYQEQHCESTMVGFVDLVGNVLGVDTVAQRLLHNGHTVMSGRSGLQICAALDALDAVVPWYDYMIAFQAEEKTDITSYGR